jgi:tetratricopeptide (TPR) repeat protein
MKFQGVAVLTVTLAWGWGVVAAPEATSEPAVRKPVEVLIQDLAHEKFRIREEASRQIWQIGEGALPALQQAAAGNDPEQAYRARELIRKIELDITPETDPEVIELVENYDTAPPEEQVNIFAKLNTKRAWRQILKLYASETSVELQARLQQALMRGPVGIEGIRRVAVTAARECLAAGDADGAREFLEMAPADAPGLLALADFHRSQGTLAAELERAKTLKGDRANAWQLALYRAAGNLEAARDAATAAGEKGISSAMSVLLGDPQPWLLHNQEGVDGGAIPRPYTELAIKRWQGKVLGPPDLKKLVDKTNSRDRSERHEAVHTLFLLGEPALAEAAYLKDFPVEAFAYLESMERIPEALKVLKLDPEKPDYAEWVAKHFASLAKKDPDDEERDVSTEMEQLRILAGFLESRGPHEPWMKVFAKPMADLAAANEERFTSFLEILFGGGSSMMESSQGAPQIAREVAVTWAGDNAGRWNDVVAAAFGEAEETLELWHWLEELNPKASRAEQFDGMLAICGMGRDPHRLRERWLALAWAAIGNTPPDKRAQLLDRMLLITGMSSDVASSLKVWNLLPESRRNDIAWTRQILNFSAAERWDDAATFFLKQIELLSGRKLDPQPHLHACAAACLRKAGRAGEAAAQDSLADKLALGNDAVRIADGYAFGGDYVRAADWTARAARQCDLEDVGGLARVLQLHAKNLLEQGRWKEAAAAFEVLGQMMAGSNFRPEAVLGNLVVRLQSDLGRALGNLKNDRAGSIAILRSCHQRFPSDGSLADDFFPSLRKAGLIKEHDEWFKISWTRMSAVVAQFPDSDNTCNTAGWLAARAQRNLDQAKSLLDKALALNPDKSVYLDTLAEVEFARGNRQKALEWSGRAVNFMPEDPTIRRQYERFRSSPLPR